MRRAHMNEPVARWAAVVVNFETGPLLVTCLRSVLADTSAGEPELVVVDNGSRDGSVAALARELPSVRQLDIDPTRPRDVDWLSGAAVWLRRSALQSVGGWDEHYFMYMEDIDLGWRLRRLGWRVAYEPGGAVMHVQAASTDRHPYRMIV